jgi:microcystin-dependent protein
MARTQIKSPGIADNSITTAKLDPTVSGALVPVGGIIMWSGAVAPTGWQLCNNTLITSGTLIGQYTPNLQDKFIVGAGSAYTVSATGGSADATLVSHSHTITDPGHNHNIAYGNYGAGLGRNQRIGQAGGGPIPTDTQTTGITIDPVGSSATNANLPPYYALAFIMRVI